MYGAGNYGGFAYGSLNQFNSEVSQSVVNQYEFLQGIYANPVNLYEWLAFISTSTVNQYEFLQGIYANPDNQYEFLQGVYESKINQYEFLQGIYANPDNQYEFLGLLTTSTINLYEFLQGVYESKINQYEFLQGIYESKISQYEFLQGIYVSPINLYEFLQQIRQSAANLYEIFAHVDFYAVVPTGVKSCRFALQTNTQTFESPLSNAIQTLELSGARWMGTFVYPVMTRAQAAPVIAFLRKLRGRQGRFYAYDPSAQTALGSGGAPWVNGAGQTGTSLNTKFWTPNQSKVLKAGDYISWNTPTNWRELHQVTDDVDSNASGNAIINITPALRESPADGTVIVMYRASCVMMLIDDNQMEWAVDIGNLHEINFSAMEVFS